MTFQQAQGDVLITQKAKSTVRKDSKQLTYDKKEGLLTVIKGEATNHHHGFRDPDAASVWLISEQAGIRTYEMQVHKDTTFDHFHVVDKKLTGEHSSLELKAGIYEVKSQREGSFEITSRGFQQQKLFKPVID